MATQTCSQGALAGFAVLLIRWPRPA